MESVEQRRGEKNMGLERDTSKRSKSVTDEGGPVTLYAHDPRLQLPHRPEAYAENEPLFRAKSRGQTLGNGLPFRTTVLILLTKLYVPLAVRHAHMFSLLPLRKPTRKEIILALICQIKLLRAKEKSNSFWCTHKIWLWCLLVCSFVVVFKQRTGEELGG